MNVFRENLTKFLPFLEDLRRRLYRGVILFISVFFVGALSAGVILKYALSMVHLRDVTVATYSPFQFADLAMDTGFFLGLIVSVPYLIYSLYAFVSPALTHNEKRRLFRSVPISVGLFALGFTYGFFILYYALQLLAEVNVQLGIANIWSVSQFFSQIFLTAALLGVVFELPLLLSLLIKLGVLKQRSLKQKRRIAYFAIFCLVSLLPPTDGVSLMAMSLPLIVLYEATILLNNNQQPYVWTRH